MRNDKKNDNGLKTFRLKSCNRMVLITYTFSTPRGLNQIVKPFNAIINTLS